MGALTGSSRRRVLSVLLVLGAVCAALFIHRMHFGVASDDSVLAHWALTVGCGEAPLAPTVAWRGPFGLFIPVAYTYYRGPWEYFSAFPFVWAVSDTAKALRAHSYFWAALAPCALVWLIAAVTASPLAALLGGLCLSFAPELIEAANQGVVLGGIPVVVLVCAAAAALADACRYRSARSWWLSCLLAGLGAGVAPQGFAFLLGWTLCVWWCRRGLPPFDGGFCLVPAALSVLAVAIGIIPLIVANCLNAGGGWRALAGHVVVSLSGVNNLDYAGNASMRGTQLAQLLGIRGLPVAVAILAQLGCLAVARRSRIERPAFIPLILFISVVAVSPLTLASLRPAHLLGLLPIACAIVAASQRFSSGGPQRALRLLSLAVLFGWGFSGFLRLDAWRRKLDASSHPGRGQWGDTYAVSDWLQRQEPTRVVIFGPSLATLNLLDSARRKRTATAIEVIQLWYPKDSPRLSTMQREALARVRPGDFLVFGLAKSPLSAIEQHLSELRRRGLRVSSRSEEFLSEHAALGIYKVESRVPGSALPEDRP